jgi:hypothetical protein
MIFVHLPTRFSDFAAQPFGFVSAAEGFVLLSALLVARIYSREHSVDAGGVRRHLWRRSLKIYGYHLALIAFTFTVVAAYAVHVHRLALMNMLDFYLAHPVAGAVGALFLLYCPPLLDILPMYILFLFLSPLVLSVARRVRWGKVMAASMALWAAAQLGLKTAFDHALNQVTHLQIPVHETGAFNLFAWQAVWVTGLWLGSASARGEVPLNRVPRWAVPVSGALCVFFFLCRFGWLGPHLNWPALGLLVDKWQLGPLRVVNLVAFTIFFWWLRKWVVLLIHREPFLTMGKASLQVFCAHLFFVFAGLALLYGDMTQLGWRTAIVLTAATFVALFFVAVREVGKKRANKAKKPAESAPAQGTDGLSTEHAPQPVKREAADLAAEGNQTATVKVSSVRVTARERGSRSTGTRPAAVMSRISSDRVIPCGVVAPASW